MTELVELVHHLAWPLAAIAVAWILMNSLRDLMSLIGGRVKMGGPPLPPPIIMPGPFPMPVPAPPPMTAPPPIPQSEQLRKILDLISVILPQAGGVPRSPVDEQKRTIDLLYATNRKRSSDDSYFSGERADPTTYGTATVRIPEAHLIGKLELPFKLSLLSMTLYEQAIDPRQHFVIETVDVRPVDAWRELVREQGLRHALVFVHGFNTTFREGLYRAAQIMWDLQYKGVPVLFSWPSRGHLLDYIYDRESALSARDSFIELLRNLRLSGVERIHILAHSMGNLVALDALASHAHVSDPLGIAEVLMAAPDIDKNHYMQIATKVRAAASGMTLYASSADRALTASKRLAGGIARAGDVSDSGPILVNDIDTIDVSPIGEELFGLGHGAYAQTRSVLNDIALVISDGKRPPSARLTEIRGMPTGELPPRWWRYSP